MTLVKQFEHSPALDTNFEGDAQVLPNGDMFVGWGQQPYFTEFYCGRAARSSTRASRRTPRATARTSCRGRAADDAAGDRVRAPNNDGTTEVWASWNGATTVSSWRVLAGPSASSLVPLQTIAEAGIRDGDLGARPAWLTSRCRRSGSNGSVLGTSPTASVGRTSGSRGVPRSCLGSGTGGLPGACATTSQACHIAVTLTSGRTVVASTGARADPGRTAAGSSTSRYRRRAFDARPRRGSPPARAHDGAGHLEAELDRLITLVPFSTRGSAPARGASQSSTLRILGLTRFRVLGRGGRMLAECLGTTPCHASTSLSVGGKTWSARPGPS